MRFGVCIGGDINKIAIAKEVGFDYVELGLSSVADWSEEKIAAFRAELDRVGMEAEATNGFFGYDEGYLTGDELNMEEVKEYTHRALSKATKLGQKVAVLGSGKARNVKDVSKMEQGKKQFAEVLQVVGDIAEQYGVTIAIEPLRAKETNLVNTVQDGLDMAQMCGHPNVNVLADFYHVFMSGESLDAIRTCGKKLQHCHIARSNEDRHMPIHPEDRQACVEWAAALKENGYDLRISLEGYLGKTDEEFKDIITQSLAVLQLFK